MKYLRLIIICFLSASTISLIGVYVLLTLEVIGTSNSDFRNLPYGIAIGVNIYLALGTFPVFLNLRDYVRSSLMWIAISFFLLPVFFVLSILLAMWNEPWPGILFCLPYLVVLTILFFHYRKSIQVNPSSM